MAVSGSYSSSGVEKSLFIDVPSVQPPGCMPALVAKSNVVLGHS